MAHYKETSPIGSTLPSAGELQLQTVRRIWQYHHKREAEQLDIAGECPEGETVRVYHGSDVLCELPGVPGVWHKQYLSYAVEK
jgi:hypothetical protein